MKRLLIVDDEQIEREGIREILQKKFPELEIQEAKNGKVALEIAKSFKPNLVLMDNKMPGLNGLETIERMNQDNPAIKFIMITAYAKFDYAQSAVKLGVKDYLLKPTKASEIVHTVGNVMNQIVQEQKLLEKSMYSHHTLQKALPIIESDVVTQLLLDQIHEFQLDELAELLHIRMVNEKFVMIILIPPGVESLYSAIKEKIRQTKSALVGAFYGGQVPVIVFRQPEISFRSQAITLARTILSVSNSDDSACWFIGLGNVYDSMDQIRQSYQESLIATRDTSLPVKYRFYSDLPTVDTGIDGYNSKEQEKQFFDQIRNGQWQEVSANVMKFILSCENEGVDLLETQQRVLELLWIASRVLQEIGVEPETPLFSVQVMNFNQLRSETNHLLHQMWQSYLNHNNQVEDNTIQKIKRYIIEHSHEEISLDGISQKIGLSPIYISKIFKEHLGINYINFLTECRIDKAKKLMMDPEKSLKEITYEVGYHDPNYFSKVFKKNCGESPTEYRKTLLGTNA